MYKMLEFLNNADEIDLLKGLKAGKTFNEHETLTIFDARKKGNFESWKNLEFRLRKMISMDTGRQAIGIMLAGVEKKLRKNLAKGSLQISLFEERNRRLQLLKDMAKDEDRLAAALQVGAKSSEASKRKAHKIVEQNIIQREQFRMIDFLEPGFLSPSQLVRLSDYLDSLIETSSQITILEEALHAL